MPGSLRDATVRPEIRIPGCSANRPAGNPTRAKDKYLQYRAELHSQRGDEVLTQNNLHEQQEMAGRRFVLLEIPASAINSGE
jgi:hypothetical protein